MGRKKKIISIILITVFLVSFFALIFSLDTIFNVENNDNKKASDLQKKSLVYFDDEAYKPKKTVNYLIVGIDSSGPLNPSNSYMNTNLNDFIVLISFNRENKTYFFLPINRDTICKVYSIGLTGKVTGSIETQLAYAHTQGNGLKPSFQNTLRSVSELLFSLDIERFVGITMSAVPVINDFFGGVTITLDEDLSALDDTWTIGSEITLLGDDSLKYVRARSEVSDGSNISRMRRQKKYITSLANKVRNGNYDPQTLLNLVDDYMCNNLVTGDYLDLKSYLEEYTYTGTYEIEGSSRIGDDGLAEFIVDSDKLKRLVIELFYNKA